MAYPLTPWNPDQLADLWFCSSFLFVCTLFDSDYFSITLSKLFCDKYDCGDVVIIVKSSPAQWGATLQEMDNTHQCHQVGSGNQMTMNPLLMEVRVMCILCDAK